MSRPAKKILPLLVLLLFIGRAAAQEAVAIETEAEETALESGDEAHSSEVEPEPVSVAAPAARAVNKPYLVGTAFGYTFSGYREETDTPLNRNMNTFSFAINSNIEKGKFFHSFNFGLFKGKNEAIEAYPLDEEELGSDLHEQFFEYYRMEDTYTRLYFEYALDYRLWGPPRFPGYLGGAIRVDSYIIERLDNIQYLNLTIIASLSVHASQKWIINAENILVFSADFPLFGYAVRPSYIGAIDWPLETGVVSLHNYWAVFGDLKYIRRITSLISLYSDVGFELSMINFPKPRRDAILRLAAGITFTF